MNWKDDRPTEKQIKAIINMQSALGKSIDIPETKGECSELIAKLKSTIENHIQVAGRINTNNIDFEGDDDYMNPGF